MPPETPPGETPVVTEPKTNANPAATPVDAAALEEARKRAEQAEMRANQLANQLKAKEQAEADAEAQRLEEEKEFKKLYEQEKARREEVETAADTAARATAIEKASSQLFSEFPDEVKTLAEEVGLSLADADESTVAAFKAKLEKISGSLKAPKVTPNNPGLPAPPATEVTGQQLHDIANNPAKFDAYMKQNYKGVAAMTRPAAQ